MSRIAQIGKFWFVDLLGFVAYGAVAYFMYTWLARYSPLFAYFANLALVILLFAFEEYSMRALESKDTHRKILERKDGARLYRLLAEGIDQNTSVKTALYLFYVVILIFSRIVDTYPTIVGENLKNFVVSNSYSIVFLIALERLIGQVSRDKTRTKAMVASIRESFAESQERVVNDPASHPPDVANE